MIQIVIFATNRYSLIIYKFMITIFLYFIFCDIAQCPRMYLAQCHNETISTLVYEERSLKTFFGVLTEDDLFLFNEVVTQKFHLFQLWKKRVERERRCRHKKCINRKVYEISREMG